MSNVKANTKKTKRDKYTWLLKHRLQKQFVMESTSHFHLLILISDYIQYKSFKSSSDKIIYCLAVC